MRKSVHHKGPTDVRERVPSSDGVSSFDAQESRSLFSKEYPRGVEFLYEKSRDGHITGSARQNRDVPRDRNEVCRPGKLGPTGCATRATLAAFSLCGSNLRANSVSLPLHTSLARKWHGRGRRFDPGQGQPDFALPPESILEVKGEGIVPSIH